MLRFLLIFFLVIYILGFIGRWLFGRWIKKVARQAQNYQPYQQKPEGEVTVNGKVNANGNEKVGEYVDYEEIKD